LGNVTEGVQGHPPESIGAGHDGSSTGADACGYTGEWGSCGESNPTNPAEAAISIEAEDAIRAGKTEVRDLQAENALSAELGASSDAQAANSNVVRFEPTDGSDTGDGEDRWWEWI
jgi:hypothetical protein